MDWKGFKPINQIIQKKMTVNFNRKYKTISFNATAGRKMKKYANIGIDIEQKAIAVEPQGQKGKYSVKLYKGKSCSKIVNRKLFDRLEQLIGLLDGKYDIKWLEDEKCFVINLGSV